MAKHIKLGEFVIVDLPKPLEKSMQPIWEYDGKTLMVAKKKYVSGYRRAIADNLYYVELFDAESHKGIPYGFLPEWLVKVKDDEILEL